MPASRRQMTPEYPTPPMRGGTPGSSSASGPGSAPSPEPNPEPVCGRFAPSPTGELHFGSLVAALASYLNSRAHHGKWLLRLDDLDQPRVVRQTLHSIPRCLAAHGLHWDDAIIVQSQRRKLYLDALGELDQRHSTYPCTCSRTAIASIAKRGAMGMIYPGTCRNRAITGPAARRVISGDTVIEFADLVQGPVSLRLADLLGDFVLCRADGTIAYHLATAVDDSLDGITEVVRGADLLEGTACQIHVQRLLGKPSPRYGHVPVAVNRARRKLSKLTSAPPLDTRRAANNLCAALEFLNQQPPADLPDHGVGGVLAWGLANWRLSAIGPQRQLTVTG